MNVKINAKEALHNNQMSIVLLHRQGISPKQLTIRNYHDKIRRS